MHTTINNKNKKFSWRKILSAFFAFLVFVVANIFPSPVFSALNKQINYQGKLTDTDNLAVPNASYNIEFKLYTSPSGGTPVWTETRTGGNRVNITNGLFSVMLGEVSSLNNVDFNQTLYLGVNIGGSSSGPNWDGEMFPRKILGVVPAAIEAEHALSADKSDIATNLKGGNATYQMGSIPYQSDVDKTSLLAPNTTTIKKFLRMTGTGSSGATPAWDILADSDIPSILTGKTYNGLFLAEKQTGFSISGGTDKTGTLQTATLTGNQTWTLPDKGGTIALTTDLPLTSNFVPYTGATGPVDLGTHSLSTTGLLSAGTLTSTGNTTLASTSGSVTNIGNTGGTSVVNVSAGTGGFHVTTSGPVTLGGTAQTGNINIGTTSEANILSLGSGSGNTNIRLGTQGTNTINIGTTTSTNQISGSTWSVSNTGNITTSGNLAFKRGTYTGTLQTATLTGNQTWTLPDKGGTIALTTDLPLTSNFVPYTGATGPVDLGTHSLSTTGLLSAGTLTSTGNTTLASTSGSVTNIGNTGGTSVVNVSAGTGGFHVTTSGPVTLGGTAQTGNINIGTTSEANILSLGSGSGNTNIRLGTQGTNTINIGTTTSTNQISGSTWSVSNTGNITTSGNLAFKRGTYTGTLQTATLTGNHSWTLPNDTGTIALTKDFVPYSGATKAVDLNNQSLSNVSTIQTNGPATFGDATKDPIIISPRAKGDNSYTGTLTTVDLTAARTWTLPNDTGTIALTGNIPSISHLVPYTGATTHVDLGQYSLSATGLASSGTLTSTGNTSLSSASGSTTSIGNKGGTSGIQMQVGTNGFTLDGVTSSSYYIGQSTTTGGITIGGTAQTGNIGIGNSTGANILSLGSGTGNTTINLGTSGANTINIGTATSTTQISGSTWSVSNAGMATIKGVKVSDLTASSIVFTSSDSSLTTLGVGNSNQFIKADGSLDSSTYLTSSAISGTPNYIPKFSTTPSALSDSQIFDSGTGVGIGTTALSGMKFRVTLGTNQVYDPFYDESKIQTAEKVSISGGVLQLFSCGYTVVGQDGLEYGTVLAADGNCWLDRNLGATRVATAYNDSQSYGDYYQWGRLKDGHEKQTSGTTSTLSSTDNPGHSNFILSDTDWRSPQNNNLWQGVDGVNNVCPAGFRLPTSAEWSTLVSAENITDRPTAYASSLKLPAAGYRDRSSGGMNLVGSRGFYWSSTVSGPYARDLYFTASSVYPTDTNDRATGFTVRCIKD